MVIENQVIACWNSPDKKLPNEGDIVVVTVSGKRGKSITYDHAFALASWFDDGLGWQLEDLHLDEFTIHAWCDLEPYKG